MRSWRPPSAATAPAAVKSEFISLRVWIILLGLGRGMAGCASVSGHALLLSGDQVAFVGIWGMNVFFELARHLSRCRSTTATGSWRPPSAAVRRRASSGWEYDGDWIVAASFRVRAEKCDFKLV